MVVLHVFFELGQALMALHLTDRTGHGLWTQITKYVSKNYDAGVINSTPKTQSEFLTKFFAGAI